MTLVQCMKATLRKKLYENRVIFEQFVQNNCTKNFAASSHVTNKTNIFAIFITQTMQKENVTTNPNETVHSLILIPFTKISECEIFSNVTFLFKFS